MVHASIPEMRSNVTVHQASVETTALQMLTSVLMLPTLPARTEEPARTQREDSPAPVLRDSVARIVGEMLTNVLTLPTLHARTGALVPIPPEDTAVPVQEDTMERIVTK
jgi:hypothetical protein